MAFDMGSFDIQKPQDYLGMISRGLSDRRNAYNKQKNDFTMRGDVVPKGYRTGQMQSYTPDQMDLLNELLPMLSSGSFLSKLASGDQSAFEEMEEPALRQFNELLGGIGTRFSSMGTGARHSSGFQNTVNQAGSDFVADLASKRNEYRRQAIRDLMGLSDVFLEKRPYDRYLVAKDAKKPSFLQQLGGGALRAGGTAAGGYFGGPAGATAGYQAGNAAASAFGI